MDTNKALPKSLAGRKLFYHAWMVGMIWLAPDEIIELCKEFQDGHK